MADETRTTDACVHHWMLSTPDRDLTAGVCTQCGATRSFTGANKTRPGSTWRKTATSGQ
jgi:hypothetical protein